MKTKHILLALLIGFFSVFSSQVFAQSTTNEQELRIEQDSVRLKAAEDKSRLNTAQALTKYTKSEAKIAKAKAKEADRIEDEASDAAKQAKQASRMEAKAQKSRIKANKQAKKAAKASEVSSYN